MNKEELLAEIDAVCMMLYQNNEHVAIGRISELLNIFQDMIQTLSQDQLQLVGNFAVVMIQELLKAYEKQDMYGMADCLMEKAVLFVSFYYGEEQWSLYMGIFEKNIAALKKKNEKIAGAVTNIDWNEANQCLFSIHCKHF